MKPLDITEMQNSGFVQPADSDFASTGHWTSMPESYLNESNLLCNMPSLINSTRGKIKRQFSDEHRRNISLSKRGQKRPDVAERNRINNPAKSLESKQKMSTSRRGKSTWNKGKRNIYSKEILERNRLAHLGKSPVNKGVIPSETLRKKMGLKNIGRSPWNKNRTDIYSSETINKIKQARLNQIFPFKDSKPEKQMQEALFWKSINFKTHVSLPGQPDIFINPNLCIFIDGDFWHANPALYSATDVMKKGKLAQEIWTHDKKVTQSLENQGYTVLRFWEHEIKNNLNGCVATILNRLN